MLYLEFIFLMLVLKYRHALLDMISDEPEYVLRNYDGLDYQAPQRPHLYLVKK